MTFNFKHCSFVFQFGMIKSYNDKYVQIHFQMVWLISNQNDVFFGGFKPKQPSLGLQKSFGLWTTDGGIERCGSFSQELQGRTFAMKMCEIS